MKDKYFEKLKDRFCTLFVGVSFTKEQAKEMNDLIKLVVKPICVIHNNDLCPKCKKEIRIVDLLGWGKNQRFKCACEEEND